jgi:hypothetical protein
MPAAGGGGAGEGGEGGEATCINNGVAVDNSSKIRQAQYSASLTPLSLHVCSCAFHHRRVKRVRTHAPTRPQARTHAHTVVDEELVEAQCLVWCRCAKVEAVAPRRAGTQAVGSREWAKRQSGRAGGKLRGFNTSAGQW